MKTILILIAALTLTACNKYGSTGGPEPIDTVLSSWKDSNGDVLDLRALTLNQELPATLVFNCDGTFGNSGKVNGINPGNVQVAGDLRAGLILFGHLEYVNASNPKCRDRSKEVYTYEMQYDHTLKICMKNYSYCSVYTKQ